MIREYERSDQSALERIFWDTSEKKEFSGAKEKEAFLKKYLLDYLDTESAVCLVYDLGSGPIGYIVAAYKTKLGQFSYYDYFEQQVKLFPSHLHINCSADYQGRGIGSALIEGICKLRKMSHIHIITNATSRNVGFYRKNGFSYEYVSGCLVFMGRAKID